MGYTYKESNVTRLRDLGWFTELEAGQMVRWSFNDLEELNRSVFLVRQALASARAMPDKFPELAKIAGQVVIKVDIASREIYTVAKGEVAPRRGSSKPSTSATTPVQIKSVLQIIDESIRNPVAGRRQYGPISSGRDLNVLYSFFESRNVGIVANADVLLLEPKTEEGKELGVYWAPAQPEEEGAPVGYNTAPAPTGFKILGGE